MTIFEYLEGKTLFTREGFKFTIHNVNCDTYTINYIYADGDTYTLSFGEFLKYHTSSIRRTFPELISTYPEYFI